MLGKTLPASAAICIGGLVSPAASAVQHVVVVASCNSHLVHTEGAAAVATPYCVNTSRATRVQGPNTVCGVFLCIANRPETTRSHLAGGF